MDPREAFCHLLAAVYASDGVLTVDEKLALNAAMAERGLNDVERRRVLLLDGHDTALAVMKAATEADRQFLLDELAAAALADGRLTHAETVRVKEIGDALGL